MTRQDHDNFHFTISILDFFQQLTVTEACERYGPLVNINLTRKLTNNLIRVRNLTYLEYVSLGFRQL